MSAATVALSVLLLTLTACVPAPDVVVPAEPSLGQPVFASDEEALAAAVEAYEAYVRVSDEIGGDGGRDPARIAEYVTPEWFETEKVGFEELSALGRSLRGGAVYFGAKLQQVWEDPIGTAHVVVYLCLDLSASRIIDATGKDITPTNRDAPIPLEVSFITSDSYSPNLVISGILPWSSSALCSG